MKNKISERKKWSDRKIKRVGKEIIESIEKYMKTITPSQAKTVLKYGTYCNPVVIKDEHYSPSKKTRKIHDDLGRLCCHKAFIYGCTTISEIKAIQIAYRHFKFEIASTCTWNGAFIYQIIKLKRNNG